MKIRLHGFEGSTRANGPGVRAAVWVQGCTIGCPGCFNPGTHDPGAGYEDDTELIAKRIAGLGGIEGVSISGGEPLQQAAAVAHLVGLLRAESIPVLVFSGYTMAAIRTLPFGPEILAQIDVLVAGPYQEGRHSGAGLLGSANQRIHLLTTRHVVADFGRVPGREVIVHRDGTMTLTGVNPLVRIEDRVGRELRPSDG